jgi:hypothetical protein
VDDVIYVEVKTIGPDRAFATAKVEKVRRELASV